MFSLLRSAPRSLSSSRLLSTLPPHLLPGSTVAVTGASGYLGSFVTAELLSRGFKVTAAVRTKEECAHLQKLPNASDNLTVSTGCDLLSPGSYDEAFSGAQGVVHMAAVVALGVGQDIVDLSVEGTRNVLESLDKAKGVKVSFSFVCLLLEGAVGCYKGFSLYLLAKLGAVESDAAHVSCLESNSYCSPFFRPFVLSSFLFSLPLPLSHSHSLSLSLILLLPSTTSILPHVPPSRPTTSLSTTSTPRPTGTSGPRSLAATGTASLRLPPKESLLPTSRRTREGGATQP